MYASNLDVPRYVRPRVSLRAGAGRMAAPWWRPEAMATFTGITLATRPTHLATAVLQGIAAEIAELMDVVAQDTQAPLGSLRVDGGLTQSRALMQRSPT